jgi:hypothetical protein
MRGTLHSAEIVRDFTRRQRQTRDGSLVAALPLDLSAELLGELSTNRPLTPESVHRGPIPRVNFAHGNAHAHLMMMGLILDSKNVILPADPAISPPSLPIVPQLGMSCR